MHRNESAFSGHQWRFWSLMMGEFKICSLFRHFVSTFTDFPPGFGIIDKNRCWSNTIARPPVSLQTVSPLVSESPWSGCPQCGAELWDWRRWLAWQRCTPPPALALITIIFRFKLSHFNGMRRRWERGDGRHWAILCIVPAVGICAVDVATNVMDGLLLSEMVLWSENQGIGIF